MTRWLVAWLALVSACAGSPVDRLPPAAPRAPKASATKAPARFAPVHAPDALVAQRLVPAGNVVEQWVAGAVTDEPREQLVMVARETASGTDDRGAGHRTLLVFDRSDGLWQRRLAATALLPCARCVSFPDQREVRIRLSLSNDRPAHINLSFDHGWVGSVGITLEYFRDYGFMVESVSRSGASQGPSRGVSITHSRVSVYPIEGQILSRSSVSSGSVSLQGDPWYDVRAVAPRWIDAETADYRRLIDLLSHDPAREPLPLNPARSLDGY